MSDAHYSKRTETDQAQTTPTPKLSGPKQHIQYTADPTRLPLYTQAWGNQPPPWLQLSVSQQEEDTLAFKQAAQAGTQTPSTPLPFTEQIQQSFGHHDISHIQAHMGSEATASTNAMQALAYTTGNDVVFAGTPDLYLTAHEAAHTVQQQAGVQLEDDIGHVGDIYEQHADAVADQVIAGRSAEDLLDRFVGVQDKDHEKSHQSGRNNPGHVGQSSVSRKGLPIQRTAVMIELGQGAVPNVPVVTSIKFFRGEETTGGAHATANIVFVEQVYTAIYHNDFATAFSNLMDLFQHATSDKTFNKGKVKGNESYKYYESLLGFDPTEIPPVYHTQIIQNLARYYILLRNEMEHAILKDVKGTKLPGEPSEQLAKTTLRSIHDMVIAGYVGNIDAQKYANSLLDLFDFRAVEGYVKGIGGKPLANTLFTRHIVDVLIAYPLNTKQRIGSVAEKLKTKAMGETFVDINKAVSNALNDARLSPQLAQ